MLLAFSHRNYRYKISFLSTNKDKYTVDEFIILQPTSQLFFPLICSLSSRYSNVNGAISK